MKGLKWFSIVIIAVGLIGFLLYDYFKPHYHSPVLNPHPTYFLTIEGTVAPEFRGVGHLVFMAEYTATKDPCFHETNVLAGMTQAESRTHYYWITPDKHNHYKIRIPIDKYKPGVCGWIPWTVSSDFVKVKKNAIEAALVSISKKGTQKYNPQKITYTCNVPNLNECNLQIDDDMGPLVIMRPNQSYHLVLNINYKKYLKENSNA